MKRTFNFDKSEVLLLFYLVYLIIISFIGFNKSADKYIFGILLPVLIFIANSLLKKNKPSKLIPIYIFVLYVFVSIAFTFIFVDIFYPYHIIALTMFILPVIGMFYSIKYYLKHKFNHWKLYLLGITILYFGILVLFFLIMNGPYIGP